MKHRRFELDKAQKYLAFRRGFKLINSYVDSGHFIGAYVLLFSILEDRLNALYAVRFYLNNNEGPPEETEKAAIHKIHFVRKVRKLEHTGDIEPQFAKELINRAYDRNRKVHAALWHNEEFKKDDTIDLLRQVRLIDKARQVQKKRLTL